MRKGLCWAVFLVLLAVPVADVIIDAALAARPASSDVRPQQMVYISPGTLADGTRVAMFSPAVPVILGLQSKSGPRVLTVGDILRCKPFDEEIEIYRKAANGEVQPVKSHQMLLNCGPMVPGGEDRILAVVGIQWNQ